MCLRLDSRLGFLVGPRRGLGWRGFRGAALELAAARDEDGDGGAVELVDWDGGQAGEGFGAGDEVAENGVFGIQVFAWGEGYEESVRQPAG